MANISLSNLTGSNVAVLHLATQPTLSDYIQPICMDNGRTFTVGSMCWAAGWSSERGGGESITQFDTVMLTLHHSTSSHESCTLLGMFLPSGFDSDVSFLIIFSFFLTLEEQVLQEFQTSVVNCGNTSTSDSICTGSFTLEQVSNEIIILSYVFLFCS